jgi:hypothetical protein
MYVKKEEEDMYVKKKEEDMWVENKEEVDSVCGRSTGRRMRRGCNQKVVGVGMTQPVVVVMID